MCGSLPTETFLFCFWERFEGFDFLLFFLLFEDELVIALKTRELALPPGFEFGFGVESVGVVDIGIVVQVRFGSGLLFEEGTLDGGSREIVGFISALFGLGLCLLFDGGWSICRIGGDGGACSFGYKYWLEKRFGGCLVLLAVFSLFGISLVFGRRAGFVCWWLWRYSGR